MASVAFAVCYALGLVVVRWRLIAGPLRTRLRAEIRNIESSVAKPSGLPQDVADRLRDAKDLIDERDVIEIVIWGKGREEAVWRLLHAAARSLVPLLDVPQVWARLQTAADELDALDKTTYPEAARLAQTIRTSVQDTQPCDPQKQQAAYTQEACWKALLEEALRLIHDNEADQISETLAWHNKVFWLVTSSLLLIVVLSLTVGNGILFLVGATGGLLSRFGRSLAKDSVSTDVTTYWTTFFLSPMAGALAGWSGILLVLIGRQSDLLGTMFNGVQWDDPCRPLTLGMAFALGFSERLLNRMIASVEKRPDDDRSSESPPIMSPEPTEPR